MKFVSVDSPFVREKYFNMIRKLPAIESLKIYEEPPSDPDEVIARIGDAELITADIYIQFDRYILSRVKNLKAIFCQSVGFNYIDVEFAKEKGIKVYNCAGYNATAVAEFVFALVTTLLRKIPAAQEHVRSGGWQYRYFEGRELHGRTMGIIGSGNVARGVANIAKGYGMKILSHTKNPTLAKIQTMGIEDFVSLPTIMKRSDVIVVTVPLDASTLNMISEKEITMMKKDAILVNTARQTVVNEYALADAIIKERIAGAVLDVCLSEPFNVKDYPMIIQEMINRPNVIVTPHIAGVSEESSENLGRVFYSNVKGFLEGSNQNCVNV